MKAVRRVSAVLAVVMMISGTSLAAPEDSRRPNILFIAIDDLNDWIGCLGGHPQTITPNLDRLAASGVLFTNAHCPAPACNPSRTAIMTGRSPHRSGLYANGQKMREVLPEAEIMPAWFSRHGYWSGGSGKLLHYFIDAKSWDEYFPKKESEDPFPRTLYPETRPVNLPVGGPWQYVETDWAALDATDEEYGGDWLVSKWVGEQLARTHDKPFFLACGIYRPHEPWFVPKKYFEPFPLDKVQLPPGYLEDDLDDLPPAGRRRGPNRYFEHIQKHDQWRQAVQSYLASIHFADAMLGRVLDALENGPNEDNTIVVLWSDHGWHLGEKQHWQKFTAWRACTRVPLMVRVPAGTPGLADGTKAGGICGRPVNLLDLFPTLASLTGIPAQSEWNGNDLTPLLTRPNSEWPQVSITHLGEPGSFGLSEQRYRLIHYANGDEELYDIATDPYEWKNLAEDPQHASTLERLRSAAPTEFAPFVPPKDNSLPKLVWKKLDGQQAPASRPDGNPFDVVFINRQKRPVTLYWMNRDGKPKSYGQIASGGRKRQQTRPGAVWMLAGEDDKPLGYFAVGDRSSRAIVPRSKQPESPSVTVPPTELGLDPFYKKFISVGGYPVVSSDRVSDYALLEAAYLIETMLAKRPDILQALAETKSQMSIMAYDEFTTDIPEHSDMAGRNGKSKDWWDRRARGLGGSKTDPVASCGEENLLCFPGDPYHEENILIHEFAHTIHLRGLNHLDAEFDAKVKATYDKAMAAGLWEGKYASTNHNEYFAEGVQSWFNNNRQPDHDHNHVDTRKELIEYDPGLAELLEGVFGDTELTYVRPQDREDQGHLKGYDYSKSPKFEWPDRLKQINVRKSD